MKNFRNLMSIIVVLTAVYSCEPEEIPNDLRSENEVNSETDNQTHYHGDDEDEMDDGPH